MTRMMREFLRAHQECRARTMHIASWLMLADRYERGRLCTWVSPMRRSFRCERAKPRTKWRRVCR